jgi:two-component system, NarL family, nitrate/nitrite response regulator NarL
MLNNSTTPTINLLIVDDHAMFREGLARSLEKQSDLNIVGQVSSSTEALAVLDESGATMVLLDVDLGSERAVDFVMAARRKGFNGQILIVTAGASDQEAVQLIQAGVSGILHKHHSTEILCGRIREIANGEVCLEKRYLGPLFRSVNRSRAPGRPKLAERERMVLRLILQGLTNRQIGERLEVGEGAIKSTLRQVFSKLGVRTRSQVVKVILEQYRDQL